MTTRSIVAAEADTGARLDRVLAAHVAELSRSRLKALIEAGAVAVGGRTIRDPSYRVNSGAAIVLDVPPPGPAKPEPQAIPLNVVYEDADIIVIDKAANMVVHPAAGHQTGTLVNALIAHCGDSLSGIGGERRPGIVHRLDKDTSGLMVVAKNDKAHHALAAQFASHGRDGDEFERGYLAFVWGAPARPLGTIDRAIDRSPHARDHMAIREGGREAVTHWRVLERYAGGAALPRSHPGGAAQSGRKAGRTGREPARVPPRNRPNPPDSGAFGLDRPSGDGGSYLRNRISNQTGAACDQCSRCPGGPWQTGAPCLSTIDQAPVERRNTQVPVGTAARSYPFTP